MVIFLVLSLYVKADGLKFVEPNSQETKIIFCGERYDPNAEDMQVLTGNQGEQGEISGKVTDENGNSLEGVLVDVWTWYPGNETKTDKDGCFSLKGFDYDQKTVEIRFSKMDFSPKYIIRQPLGIKDATVVLNNKTYFEGIITDDKGSPVANAAISAIAGPKKAEGVRITEIPTTTSSNADGTYRLYVQADTYDLQVKSEIGVLRLNKIDIAKDQSKKLDMALQSALTFRANVIDSVNGLPVDGFRIFKWKYKHIDGTSDANGIIEIKGMMPGRTEFWVDSPKSGRWWSEQCVSQWNRYCIAETSGGWQRNFDGLDFEISRDMNTVTIIVEKPVIFKGTVVDPNGNPVAGAIATLAKTGSGNSITGDTRYSFTTDSNGYFEMTVPASNDAEYNLIAHDGKYEQWRNWANGVLPPVKTEPGQVFDNIVIKLTNPATVKGRVRDIDGKAVPNHQVRAHSFDKLENRYYDPATRTDKDGNFEIKFIRPGKHYIQVYPFWLTAEQAPDSSTKIVDLKEGQVVEGIELIKNDLPY